MECHLVDVNKLRCYAAAQMSTLDRMLAYGIECDEKTIRDNIQTALSYVWIVNRGCEVPDEISTRISRFYTRKVATFEFPERDCGGNLDCQELSITVASDAECPSITITEIEV